MWRAATPLSHLQIGQLFIAGFGSSMVFGTIVGSLADRYGRKLNCIIFVVLYVPCARPVHVVPMALPRCCPRAVRSRRNFVCHFVGCGAGQVRAVVRHQALP